MWLGGGRVGGGYFKFDLFYGGLGGVGRRRRFDFDYFMGVRVGLGVVFGFFLES